MTAFLAFFVFAACVGFSLREGTWTNLLRLINLVTAGLLTMNFYEPVAGLFFGYMSSFTYFLDFLAVWLLFAIIFGLLRLVTDSISRVKVRFLALADRIVSPILSVWIGLVMTGFTMMTLHMAPLDREFLFGSFVAEKRASSSISTEMMWLGFVQQESQGAFARAATERETQSEKYVFDPKGEFMLKYASRRAALGRYAAKTGALRVADGDLPKHN